MAGELTPAVLFARFTTFAGVFTTEPKPFATVALEVTPYQGGLINVWRGKIVGTSVAPKFNFQESSDGVKWTACGGYSVDFDPGENAETQYAPLFKKKWMRMTVELGHADNVLTLWASGFFEDRES